jgi:hypothetical protein
VHGSLSGTPPNLVYTPDSGFTGSDNFTFNVNDGFVNSAEATASITMNLPASATVYPDDLEQYYGNLVMMLQDLFTSSTFVDNLKLIEGKIDKILQDLFFSHDIP